MNEIVSFTKEIEFKTMINKISSISLEHTLMCDDNISIKGDLIVSGTYKQTIASQIDNPFSYKIPVDIEMDEKYDLSNLTVDIDDFTYEIVDDNKLKLNIDLIIDNLQLKEKKDEEKKEDNVDDELVNVTDLFLENDDEKKLEVERDDLETLTFDDNKEEKKEEETCLETEENIEKENVEDEKKGSLFSNLTNSNETYSTYSIYVIRENDTIDKILNNYKISREKLEEYNDLNEIKIGTKLIIPSTNE